MAALTVSTKEVKSVEVTALTLVVALVLAFVAGGWITSSKVTPADASVVSTVPTTIAVEAPKAPQG